ncbi:MAG: caspase family protein, partial [Betaproteobacteria bacterium]|nr:caspase family protein [Betaproteobacteria bacterium]
MRKIKYSARFSGLAFAAILCVATVVLPPPAAGADQRVALVIGNSAYPSSRLPNPVNDAKAMAEKLKSLGFDVILKTDANQREMTRSFSEFGRKLVPGSVSLFYYAGHGMQVRGKNFLIPVDAEIDNEASVRSEAVDVDQIFDHLGSARLSMIILDACRNNPFERRIRNGAGSGLAQIDAPTGTLLAYATAPGKVAADGSGANGLYTSELLKAIDTPALRIEDVFKQVRINVLKASDNQQIPWESSSLTSEFYFRPGTTSGSNEKLALQQAAQMQAELQKALQEERRKRERDAESVKVEMEKLRAELLALRTAPASGPVAIPTTAAAAVSSPGMQSPASVPSAPQTQTATATGVASSSPTAASATEQWTRRLALLQKSPTGLGLSKAVAILLDISADAELSLLLVHEAEVKSKSWHNAYAMGTDSRGNLIWGGGYQLRAAPEAAQTAVEFCSTAAGESCKVVLANGEFREMDFLTVAKQMGAKSIGAAREAFIKSLLAKPRESQIGSAAGRVGTQGGWSIGYASIREPQTVEQVVRVPGPHTTDWAARIALLENFPEPLTFAKAMIVLLDAGTGAAFIEQEKELQQMQWQSA